MKTEFIVREASAQMPASCWGQYKRVAVLEVEKGVAPKMISERARGVIRIVRVWENCNVGRTDRCAYARARREALRLCDELNSEKEHAPS